MDPNDNSKLALQKAISAHEQAEASLGDLMRAASVEPRYREMLDRVLANLAELRAESATEDP